ANGPFVYGHVWVVLGLLAAHPAWGVIALPLLARLYIREKSLASITPEHRPAFTTKLELAVDLMRWSVRWLGFLGKPLWVVVDGAYAKAPFLKPMRSLGVTMVSRLRRDAALWTTPRPRRPGQRGRKRIYGKHRIDLAKRAGQRRGWATGTFDLYGKAVVKRYKTFVATWQPAGGTIRVVLVDEPTSGPPTSAPALPRRRPTSSGAWPTAPAWRTPNQTTPQGGGGSAPGGSVIIGVTALLELAAWCRQ